MVSKVKVLPYQCEVCKKTFATEKQAEKCENSHEETKQKEALAEANRMKLHNRLVEIRNTAESWQELQDKALVELKAAYGDDFVLVLPHNYKGRYGSNGFMCTYAPSKKPKKNDFFSPWSDSELDSSRIIKTLGFHTGSGSGDGKVYSYHVTYGIRDFPAIFVKYKERQRAVEQAVIAIKYKAEDYNAKVKQDDFVSSLNQQQRSIQEQIDDLQEKLKFTVAKRQQYIKDVYYNYYEQECNAIIAELPQQFKNEHSSPRPIDYFRS